MMNMKIEMTTIAMIAACAVASQASAQSCRTFNGHGTTMGGAVSADPGAAAYGAEAQADRTATVYIDGLNPWEPTRAVVISPWHRIDGFDGDRAISYPAVGHVSRHADGVFPNAFTRGLDTIADRLEVARLQWLKDNGYVGGVRVFTSSSPAEEAAEGAGLPEPRGIIVVPDSVKRQKTRFQVQGNEPIFDEANPALDGATRISLPPMMRVSTIRIATPESEQVAPSEKLLADAGL